MAVGVVYLLYAVVIIIAMANDEYIPETIIVCLSLHFAGLLYGLASNCITSKKPKPFTLYPDSVSPWAEGVDVLQAVAFIFTILHVSGDVTLPSGWLYAFCALLLSGIILCWIKVLSKNCHPRTNTLVGAAYKRQLG